MVDMSSNVGEKLLRFHNNVAHYPYTISIHIYPLSNYLFSKI